MPRTVSPGSRSAKYIAMFAFAQPSVCTFDGQGLHGIGIFLPAIVTPPGIAFRILVGEDGEIRLAHCARDVILGRNEFESFRLPFFFALESFIDLRVLFLDERIEFHRNSL